MNRKNYFVKLNVLILIPCVMFSSYLLSAEDVMMPAAETNPEPNPKLYTLEGCYQMALHCSQQIAISQEAVEETKAQFFKAASEALGNVDFVISHTLQDRVQGSGSSSNGSVSTAPSRRERKFAFDQPLFQGFKALGAIRGAGSLSHQRKAEKIRAEHLLFIDVAKAFYGILEKQKNLDILSEIHTLYEDRINDLKEREKIGRSRTSEVVTANSKMKLLEAELAGARGELLIAKYELQFLTGVSLTAEHLKDLELPSDNKGLDDYMKKVELRPDVVATREAMKILWQNIIVAQSGLWPQIMLEGNAYQKREGSQSAIDWDLLFKITVPIFKGGENAGNIQEAFSLWKQGKYGYEQVKREAGLEIERAFQNWLSVKAESVAFEEARKAAEENFNIQKDEYSRNLVNNLDVLEALQTLHETKKQAVHAYYQVKEDYDELRVATGEIR